MVVCRIGEDGMSKNYYYVELKFQGGELQCGFICMVFEDVFCCCCLKDVDMCELWICEEVIEIGYLCWVFEWVDVVGIEDVIIGIVEDQVFVLVVVIIIFEEGVGIELIVFNGGVC